MMTLDDGATDGQANPHTVAFSRVERIEELVHRLRFQTRPRVLHSQTNAIAFVSFGSDHQLPWTVLDVAHRVRGVQEQVQHHLLKLDTIAYNWREVFADLAEGRFRDAALGHVLNRADVL